jgi:hypothetical protein
MAVSILGVVVQGDGRGEAPEPGQHTPLGVFHIAFSRAASWELGSVSCGANRSEVVDDVEELVLTAGGVVHVCVLMVSFVLERFG